MSEFGAAGEVLDRAINSNRLHHAVLLYGGSIVELERLAKHCAGRLLNVSDPARHPDFFELRPSGKARNIKIGSDSDRVGGEWPRKHNALAFGKALPVFKCGRQKSRGGLRG